VVLSHSGFAARIRFLLEFHLRFRNIIVEFNYLLALFAASICSAPGLRVA
jgi:hypothetical protein